MHEVTMFGPPDEVNKEQVDDIAEKLYARVQDAPSPKRS